MIQLLWVVLLDLGLPLAIAWGLLSAWRHQARPHAAKLQAWKEALRQAREAKEAELRSQDTDYERLNELMAQEEALRAQRPPRPWWAPWLR